METSYTILYESYKNSNAKIVDFHGWNLPVYFSSIKEETINTRKNACLFDASHMGEFIIEGTDAENFVNYIITNSTLTIPDYKIVYSPICNESGGIIDDLLVYKFNKEKFLLVVNASNMEKDWLWINNFKEKFNVSLKNVSAEYSLIALQGPRSSEILNNFVSKNRANLKYYTFTEEKFNGIEILLSRTGYTGENGFEILVKNENAVEIWETLLNTSGKYNLLPAGLGARDVLRIEAGYPLYGNDLTDTINPFEAGIGWTVKFEKDFIGRNVLEKAKNTAALKRIGILMELNRVPREKNEILLKNEKIGEITSGTFSFNLNKAIGMALINKKYLDIGKIDIKIHQKLYKGEVHKLPFINNISL